MHFLEWKCWNFNSDFIDIYSWGSIWQYVSNGLGNALVSNRQQAIIWTDADPVKWRIYAAIGEDELLSGVPDYFDRNKISSGGDLSHYSSASLY